MRTVWVWGVRLMVVAAVGVAVSGAEASRSLPPAGPGYGVAHSIQECWPVEDPEDSPPVVALRYE